MAKSTFHRLFGSLKKAFPPQLLGPIRRVVTALSVPVAYSYRTGHFKSSLKMAAVSKHGEPIPWYTYPCIDFLRFRDYTNKTVLEFGGGQSSLWWASRAKSIVTMEGNLNWYDRIKSVIP